MEHTYYNKYKLVCQVKLEGQKLAFWVIANLSGVGRNPCLFAIIPTERAFATERRSPLNIIVAIAKYNGFLDYTRDDN